MKKTKNTRLLNRDNYVPFYLVNIANKYSRAASRLYLRLFGIGIIEWRMISVIAIEGNITANEICSAIHLDKGAASRSIKSLETAGYVRLHEDESDSRKRLISLTPEGLALHNKILAIALRREMCLLEGFDAEERELFIRLLKRVNENLNKLELVDSQS